MENLSKEEIREIIKKLKRKFNSESVEYLGYKRFALIESQRMSVPSGANVAYPKIRKYRLTDEQGTIIKLENEYNFITTFARGFATVIIIEIPRILEDTTGLKATERKSEGLIDTNGRELLPCIYDSVNVHLDGFIELSKDGEIKATNLNDIITGKFNWDNAIPWH